MDKIWFQRLLGNITEIETRKGNVLEKGMIQEIYKRSL